MAPIIVNSVNKTAEELHPSAKTTTQEFFDTKHLKGDLKQRSIRGGAVTMAAQATKFVLNMGSTIILARLLAPQDYGLIAMVTAITGFVAMFKDMGLSLATIQKPEISHAQVSTLFWINVAVSMMLASILAVLAPIISWFYNEPRLTYITFVLASTFLFSGLTVQHQALLRRQMQFLALAVIEIGSMATGVATGITMAWYGAGYWALVGYSAAMALSNAVLVWLFCEWRPGLPVRRAGVRSMVAFGGYLTGFSIVGYFARNFDNILLGRFYGAGVLGLYSRAYSIMMLPISQIREPLNSVAIPALSHIQSEAARYRTYYIKLVTLLAFITMPLMVFLFVCANQVIDILLGNQWSGATSIFKILCITAFIQPVSTTTGLVLVSLGQSKRFFIIGTINNIIYIISFFLGLPWGAVGVAVAYTIANYVTLVPVLWLCFGRSPISVKDFFSTISRQAVASILMGFVILAILPYLSNLSNIVSIVCLFITGFMAYLIVLSFMPGGLLLLKELLSYRHFLFQGLRK